MAVLIYFLLIINVHRDLPELYLIMARGLVIFLLTIFGSAVFYIVMMLFGKGIPMPFTAVLMAAFVVVIFIDPIKIIIKKSISSLFPTGRDILTSLFAVDEEAQKEKNVLLEEMGTVLAHEIRNPLGSIKGAAQYLRSETEPGDKRKLLDIIVEETDRLNGVVSHFLNYARPYALTLDNEDMNDIVEKAISILNVNHVANNVVFEKDLHGPLPKVMVDREQITQVILNIALNGIECHAGGWQADFPDDKNRKRRTGRSRALNPGHRQGNDKGRGGQHFQTVFYHKKTRHWAGPVYLPKDNKGPQGADQGKIDPWAREHLLYPAWIDVKSKKISQIYAWELDRASGL